MCTFKVHNILILYICILQYDYHLLLANTSIRSHNSHFFFVVGTIKVQSLSSFNVYNTALLSVITVLCVKSPGPIYLLVASLYLKQQFPHPQPLVTTMLLSLSLAFLDSVYK